MTNYATAQSVAVISMTAVVILAVVMLVILVLSSRLDHIEKRLRNLENPARGGEGPHLP